MKNMILAILVAFAALPSLAPAQQVPFTGTNGQPAKATVAGTVVRSTSGEPIARATVTLIRVEPQGVVQPAVSGRGGGAQTQQAPAQGQQQPQTVTATTDDQGKFQFKDVDDGSYRIAAARNGFARQEYGQRSFNRTGTVVNILAGQPVGDISIRLMPAGTISGRVMDSTGEPLPGVTVQALRSVYDATGKRNLQPAASARTNDLGEYRIYWINPGRYFVSANSARSAIEVMSASASQAATQGQNQAAAQAASLFGATTTSPNEVPDGGLGLTYYPSSPDATRAVGLDLQPGAELRAIDFTLVRTQRVRITGRVIDTTTGRPPQNAAVSVTPRDATPGSPLDAFLGMDPSGGNRYNSATGEFVVASVSTGSYWLQVMAQRQASTRPPGPDVPPNTADALAMLNSINSARIPIDVLGSDIDNLTLNISPGMPVPGRVRVDGAPPANPSDLQRIGIALQSTSGGVSILSMIQGGVVRPAADGTFSIPRITSGDYKLAVNGLPPNSYVKEARLGRSDVLNGVTIPESLTESLEIVLRMNPGQIAGSVTDAALKPVGGVQAVLVPENRSRQDLYKTAVTDQDGRFTFRAVTPGDYRVFAWEDIEPFAYFDPAVVKQHEAAGKLVRIQESSTESADVKLIPAGTP